MRLSLSAALPVALLGIVLSPSPLFPAPPSPPAPEALCDACVRADLNFLAADELHGRGSATRDEHLAALYAASLFQSFGLEPAGDWTGNSYIERAPIHPFSEPMQAYLKKQGFDRNERTDTWNAAAILRGSDPEAAKEVILLTAHLDHLGLGNAAKSDPNDIIYNGADDDASGTTAVLELARALSKGPRPRRTILFVLFGSEELGGDGNAYFLDHSPVPLTQIVTNLEFEMIGRPDPMLPNRTLWLTGYERSNLGPELAKHGAAISADPHPEQKFFQRSDNYALAKRGIVAQTVSSFGLHKDYHQPSDDLSRIDFDFLTHSIASMIEPVRWLADSKWRPEWNSGGKPE
ncbi:MAG TPA: M28 family peptidase [Acidobacteriaceae bacterium]|nr:M28 family peptidase [Acidobacteriaceae bacterium]